MAIKLTIHRINKELKTAVVSLSDGEYSWIKKKNISLKLNPDGTANTTWLAQWTKLNICSYRLKYIDKNEKDLV